VQIQAGNPRLQGVTLPVTNSDNKQLVGYVRASQSLEEFDEAMRYLDWGMIGGIAIALGLSGVGGILLTRQAMQPIEHSFIQLKQFTADASHELRPLMAIASNAQVALRYPEGIRPKDIASRELNPPATTNPVGQVWDWRLPRQLFCYTREQFPSLVNSAWEAALAFVCRRAKGTIQHVFAEKSLLIAVFISAVFC